MSDSNEAQNGRIRLQHAGNEVVQEAGHSRQDLFFVAAVDNIAYAKRVDILWAGRDGVWHTLPATFHSMAGDHSEYWIATASLHLASHGAGPDAIRFALRCQMQGEEHWDNNGGANYVCPAHSYMRLGGDRAVFNLGPTQRLHDHQRTIAVSVAVHQPVRADQVVVHWTTDDWQNVHVTPCQPRSRLERMPAGGPEEEACEIWSAVLNAGDAFRIQYSVCCESGEQAIWDNNDFDNYSPSRKPLNVLVLNLHCRQEDDQDYKFSEIAKAIDELSVDVVCLQEVSEDWNDAQGDWASNSARIINDRLEKPFHIHNDWSHLGFGRYREGVAILSRYPFSEYDSRYVSNKRDPYSIDSRKVVMGKIAVPYFGAINVFSVHVSWWENGFAEQFDNLHQWARSRRETGVTGTLLCGDFNVAAGSPGYARIVAAQDYDDQFLAVHAPATFAAVFRERKPGWQSLLANDGRIDFAFLEKSSALKVTSARQVFTGTEYAEVSDHQGVLLTFEPASVLLGKRNTGDQ
ncbi:endonuclease [Parasulfuritortus cantonensis]|uniref:Endonuclease n=1 Tax=Parasulfuritortus cantonensis TaxID=2528202 RepID=A0A4R1BPC4_9PROT|nr:endonuclease/exonuclease/phosphatase family protein [Parasulfuritortus cantonensis]TCJ19513.1 endonuclease [Parasulfuritortus cantonensis]